MRSMKPNIVIEIEDVSKRYGAKNGIERINALFESEWLHVLVGANGSGKTTLLKCIMGLVHYEGKISKKKFRIGYAPEEYVMPYFMSIREFLKTIGKIRCADPETLEMEIQKNLLYFDLVPHGDKAIGKLSNGMRQKVNLVQAFLHHPKILLLDEPLHALDAESQEKAIDLIKERMSESLIIVSTHNPEKFKIRNRRIWNIKGGKMDFEVHA